MSAPHIDLSKVIQGLTLLGSFLGGMKAIFGKKKPEAPKQ